MDPPSQEEGLENLQFETSQGGSQKGREGEGMGRKRKGDQKERRRISGEKSSRNKGKRR